MLKNHIDLTEFMHFASWSVGQVVDSRCTSGTPELQAPWFQSGKKSINYSHGNVIFSVKYSLTFSLHSLVTFRRNRTGQHCSSLLCFQYFHLNFLTITRWHNENHKTVTRSLRKHALVTKWGSIQLSWHLRMRSHLNKQFMMSSTPGAERSSLMKKNDAFTFVSDQTS